MRITPYSTPYSTVYSAMEKCSNRERELRREGGNPTNVSGLENNERPKARAEKASLVL